MAKKRKDLKDLIQINWYKLIGVLIGLTIGATILIRFIIQQRG